MKKLVAASAAILASSNAALAAVCDPNLQVCDVPEISALEGTAAIAAIAAIVLIAWERRRRAV